MDNFKIKEFYENKIYPLYLNIQNKIFELIQPNDEEENNDDNTYNTTNENSIFILGKKTDPLFAREKIESIPYFCYRNNFEPLKNDMTDDIGWGCMIRTGQMMLCHSLCHIFKKPKNDIIHNFFDTPKAPFSIHKITEHGEKFHIPIGNWFNPTGIGYTIKSIVANNNDTNILLHVIIGKDGSIYDDEIIDILNNKKSVLILIPTMLGIGKVEESYYKPLLKCFETRYNIGVVGGKPKQSFYFIGKRDERLFYLDPHTIKPSLLSVEDAETNFSLNHLFESSFKDTISKYFFYENEDNIINSIKIGELDPSMLLCFLLRSPEEFNEWKEYIKKNVNQNSDSSLFSIMDKKEFYTNNNTNSDEEGDWVDI